MPKFLDTQQSRGEDDGSRRRPLAIWLASSSNMYFAKATVNRVWAQLFGRGLVEPVDDLGTHNPPSHPQLLDELAGWFVETGLRFAGALPRAGQYTGVSAHEPVR